MNNQIVIRNPESIYQIKGAVENGAFSGRWYFSFDKYYDPQYMNLGTLRVFNDDTLSPGAVWPLHPHREIEVVTYCAEGEFRHADEKGRGGVLKKGWVQHTTVGRGMWHSEINNRPDTPMRFIQMWFIPSQRGLEPSVEQMAVDQAQRTNCFFPLVTNAYDDSLFIESDAGVYACFLPAGKTVDYILADGRGAYLYVLEGGPVTVNGHLLPALGAAKITGEIALEIQSEKEAELLLVDVLLMEL